MDKEKLEEYKMKITQANPTELVVIIYDLILLHIDEAVKSFESGDVDEAVELVKKAQAFLQEQMGSVDTQYDIGKQLLNLYRYVNEQLISTTVKRKPVNIDSCKEVISGLRDSYAQISDQDTSGPVMENTQQIYSGLTYGRNSMSGTYVDNDESRGYKA